MKIHELFTKPNAFERHYNAVREKENRILSIEEIKKLPFTETRQQHHAEWQLRVPTYKRLRNYLRSKKPKRLLDLGCGNGWLLHQLAQEGIGQAFTGLEVNKLELKQAAEVLDNLDNVDLVYGDIFEYQPKHLFDIIIINACLQYFPDLQKLLQKLTLLLTENGEIHILDSPFYSDKPTAEAAKKRSEQYYAQQGVVEMSIHYFHHTMQDFSPFKFQIQYNPTSLASRFKRRLVSESPFHWIRVSKQKIDD